MSLNENMNMERKLSAVEVEWLGIVEVERRQYLSSIVPV